MTRREPTYRDDTRLEITSPTGHTRVLFSTKPYGDIAHQLMKPGDTAEVVTYRQHFTARGSRKGQPEVIARIPMTP